MELIVDFSSDLQNEKYNMFIDTLYENNHLENYIKKVLELEEVESDRPLYLSLLLTDYDTLGDIIISLERVEEQASEYNHSFEREFYYVLTHGILHILGYDHIEEEDKKIMRKREEAILSSFGYTRDK